MHVLFHNKTVPDENQQFNNKHYENHSKKTNTKQIKIYKLILYITEQHMNYNSKQFFTGRRA